MLAKDIASSLDIKPSITANNVDYVLTDPSRINQLLINLTINAIKVSTVLPVRNSRLKVCFRQFTAPSSYRQITITLDCSLIRPTLPGAAAESNPQSPGPGAVAPRFPQPNELYLLISISDTGCVLSQEEISGLFQRFKQANPKTHISYGGSGLGLFVCRRIVSLLGGEISVTSQVGKGSTFSVGCARLY